MWEITRDIAQEDPANVCEESRVGHSEQHSRISQVEYRLGVRSEELPNKIDDPEMRCHGAELRRVRFRTKDDDGEVYYEGWLHDDEDCENQTAALKFAETDVGCTVIEVRRHGKWVQEIG